MNLQRANAALAIGVGACLVATWSLRGDDEVPNWQWMPDMAASPAYDAFSPNPHLPRGQTLQPPPAGVLGRDEVRWTYGPGPEQAARAGVELTSPLPPDDPAALARGADRYRVFCAPCHGPQGLGDGSVTQRGYPPPPPLPTGKSASMRDGQLFHIITAGQGGMAGYASQLSPDDRWRVVLHVRKLQADARLDATPATDTTPVTDATETQP